MPLDNPTLFEFHDKKERPFGEGLIIDNFAGGGGASTGIEWATGRSPDVAINHDEKAVAMHKANHPNTKHYCQNIYQVDPVEVVRDAGGGPVDLCWFSPDCKHFSKAKGAAKVSKSVRDLAWVVIPWAKRVRPKVIILENVEEFRTWCDIDYRTNLPIKGESGKTFQKWVKALKKEGYEVQWRLLSAKDYGSPTTRTRFFLIARCDGLPIIWPKPTHGNGLKPIRTVAECIDWSLPGISIFNRKKPLAENTMKRIFKGIQRFVIDTDTPFILNENKDKTRPFTGRLKEYADTIDLDGVPLNITAQSPDHMVATHIIKHNTGATGSSMYEPMHTIVAGSHKTRPGGCAPLAIAATHIMKMRGQNIGHSTDSPLQTISAGGKHFAKVDTQLEKVEAFLLKYYGTSYGTSLNDPIHTIRTKECFGLITIHGEPYRITDIQMRMLKPHELFRAQGFDDDYKIDPIFKGKPFPQYAMVSCCGNSVNPQLSRALVASNYVSEPNHFLQAAE